MAKSNPLMRQAGLDACHLELARSRYRRFIEACASADGGFRLTPRSDCSPYATCFAIFGYRLLQEQQLLAAGRDSWTEMLRQALLERREATAKVADIRCDKSYLQLLTFTLSALSILGTLSAEPLEELVVEVIPADLDAVLRRMRVFDGAPRSGNFAMFLAILLLHAGEYLERDTGPQLKRWVDRHLGTMNRFGFWGPAASMSHLQFQNGYHQYEILEFLGTPGVPWRLAATSVASLADTDGHFAPYPGGGGCYDYDAIFILTATTELAAQFSPLLVKSASTILSEQNPDGGFCESRRVRPRSVDNLLRAIRHVAAGRGAARRERMRQAVTLLRRKHDRIQTHWTKYAREWGESDLWDSWFRMLAVARIDVALNPDRKASWGFIDYPGIGFHHSLRARVGP